MKCHDHTQRRVTCHLEHPCVIVCNSHGHSVYWYALERHHSSWLACSHGQHNDFWRKGDIAYHRVQCFYCHGGAKQYVRFMMRHHVVCPLIMEGICASPHLCKRRHLDIAIVLSRVMTRNSVRLYVVACIGMSSLWQSSIWVEGFAGPSTDLHTLVGEQRASVKAFCAMVEDCCAKRQNAGEFNNASWKCRRLSQSRSDCGPIWFMMIHVQSSGWPMVTDGRRKAKDACRIFLVFCEPDSMRMPRSDTYSTRQRSPQHW